MDIKELKISELKNAGYNPRQMDDEEMENLKNSIKEFGMVEPIVVNKDFTVIGGHQRLKAVREIGWTDVPCIVVDLDKKKEKILNLALNRIVGRWDEEKLVRMIKEISENPDIKMTGFKEEEIDQFLVQFEIGFSDQESADFSEDEEIKKIFERYEKIEIPVHKMGVAVRKDKIGFYCKSMDEWKAINDHFKTTRKGELDIDRLIGFIK